MSRVAVAFELLIIVLSGILTISFHRTPGAAAMIMWMTIWLCVQTTKLRRAVEESDRHVRSIENLVSSTAEVASRCYHGGRRDGVILALREIRSAAGDDLTVTLTDEDGVDLVTADSPMMFNKPIAEIEVEDE